MLKFQLLLIILLKLMLFQLSAQQAANQFRRIDNENGLSNNQINTIFSDRKGVLWIATVSGLNRFDGYTFRIFKNKPDDPTSLPENSIQRIYEDNLGYLWLFTTHAFYVFNPLTEEIIAEHPFFSKFNIPKYSINALRLDNSGNLWIANSQTGLYYLNTKTGELRHFNKDSGLSSNQVQDVAFCSNGLAYVVHASGVVDVLDGETLTIIQQLNYFGATTINPYPSLFIDSNDDLWFYSMSSVDGVIYVERKTGTVLFFNSRTHPALSSNLVSGLLEDNAGNIWVATDHGGINVIDKNKSIVRYITNVPGDATSLSANTVTCIHKSPDNIIWVGTYKNGVNYFHEQLYQFKLFSSQPHQTGLYFSNDVNCFAEDKNGNLWIGTNGSGLVYFNRQNNTFKTYRHSPINSNSISNDIIVHLCVDHKNRLWIGTYQGGLNCFDGSRFKHYRNNPQNASSLSDDRIWQIFQDRNKRIWIGTLGGGLELYDENSDAFIHHRAGDYNSVNSNFILALNEDRQGNLLIGTSDGLNILDAQTGRFRHYTYNEDNPLGLSHPIILSVLEDRSGRLWVGTRNGLNLLNRADNTFTVYREEHGLPDNNIISMLEDDSGNFWIATLNGLSNLKTDAQGKIFFRNFDVLDGLQGREFNEHSALLTSKGEMIFGGAYGFNIFKPSEIIEHHHLFNVVLTDFKLFNQSVKIGEKKNGHIILNKAIHEASEISLRHNQNVFSIEFSALNYFQPERTRFSYMLEGFNNQWIETDARNRVATYTNLNPGTYIFRVKATASDGSWGDEETTLQVKVIPPFYATPLAYVIYFLFFVSLVLLLVFTIRRRAKMHYLREQEKLEYQRMRDLDDMKIRFFTNVSHEFRTPLTLIITPLDKLLKQITDIEIREQLVMIQRNGRRLLNLVNQLLDIRKLEVDRLSLNLNYGNVARFLEECFNSFSDLMESKQISSRYESNISEYLVNFDQDKLEKILFNLLSNAIKFTHEKGNIYCRVNRFQYGDEGFVDTFNGHEYLEIQIEDDGIGIAPEKQTHIFDRFYQVEQDASIINQGSGIGLSLSQEFVKMHNGTIQVESEVGKGTRFIVRLPLTVQAVSKEILPHISSYANEPAKEEEKDAVAVKDGIEKGTKPAMLIVEDNDDLRHYLKDNLQQQYTIFEAANGRDGWHLTLAELPKLVISDVLMPVVNGIDLCRRIKNDARTSHIPVILLTARTADEQKIEGLEAGADDYITKPFSYEILELKIKRLIEMRESFQSSFNKKFEIKPGEIGITSLDEKFLKKALKIVEKNIGNTEFSVEKLGRELGVSRGHLYNKLMALTGTTPIGFIRVMRLKRAAQLLAKSQLSVSEIAFQVGFNDPKYFTKYFKDEFGVVPSEFAKNPKSID